MTGDKGDALEQFGSGPLNIEMASTMYNTHAMSQAAPTLQGSHRGLASARGLLGSEMHGGVGRTAVTGPSSRAQPDTPGRNGRELYDFAGSKVMRRQNSNTVGQASSLAGRPKVNGQKKTQRDQLSSASHDAHLRGLKSTNDLMTCPASAP